MLTSLPAHYTWRILLVPFNVLQLYLLALGISLILSTLYVYFRDVAHIWDVLMQAMFYATNHLSNQCDCSASPDFAWASKFLMLNPSTQVIMDIRHNLLSPEYIPTVWTYLDSRWLPFLFHIC